MIVWGRIIYIMFISGSTSGSSKKFGTNSGNNDNSESEIFVMVGHDPRFDRSDIVQIAKLTNRDKYVQQKMSYA